MPSFSIFVISALLHYQMNNIIEIKIHYNKTKKNKKKDSISNAALNASRISIRG